MTNRVVVLAVFCVFWFSPAEAKISLNPEKSITNLIREFKAALESIIKTASLETQITLAQSINNLNIFLQNAERAYGNTVGATVKDLERIEIDAFERAANLLEDVSLSIANNLDRPLSSVEDISALLAEGIAFSSKPIVTRYSPAYVSPSYLGDGVRITIGGLRLHTADFGKPRLDIGDEVFYGSATDRTIVFDIPRSVFPAQKVKPTSFEAKLLLEAPSGIWSVNRWLSRPQIVTYGLSFVVLPDKLGDYTVSGVKIVTEIVRNDYAPDPAVVSVNHGGGGVTPKVQCYQLPEDLDFDLSTAKVEWVSRHGGAPGGRNGRADPNINIGDVGFDPTTVLDRKRICIKVTAGTGCKECNAASSGKLVVKTVKKVEHRPQLKEEVKQLGWDDVPIEIDEKVPNQAVNVSIFGSPRRTILLGRSEPISPFLRVDVYSNKSTAIIRPIIPAR